MIAGFAAIVLIAYNGIIDRPGQRTGRDRRQPRLRLLGRAARRDRDRGHRLHPLARERRAQDAQGARHRLTIASRAWE